MRCDAILVDLRGAEKTEQRLADRNSYEYTQRLGRYLREQSQNGLLLRSARHAGDNAAILRAAVLSDVREKCFLTYRMNPLQDEIEIERAPGKRWLQLRPSALG